MAQEGESSEDYENCKLSHGNTNHWCSLLLRYLRNLEKVEVNKTYVDVGATYGDQYAGPKDAGLLAADRWAALEGEAG